MSNLSLLQSHKIPTTTVLLLSSWGHLPNALSMRNSKHSSREHLIYSRMWIKQGKEVLIPFHRASEQWFSKVVDNVSRRFDANVTTCFVWEQNRLFCGKSLCLLGNDTHSSIFPSMHQVRYLSKDTARRTMRLRSAPLKRYQKNNAIPKAFDSYKNAKLEQLVRIKII